jgi:hypothetical protein
MFNRSKILHIFLLVDFEGIQRGNLFFKTFFSLYLYNNFKKLTRFLFKGKSNFLVSLIFTEMRKIKSQSKSKKQLQP